MTAYNATPTAALFDLLVAARSHALPVRVAAQPVAVALWEPSDPLMPVAQRSPATAVVAMSAALYVRLFPHGHYGPTIVDQVSP